MYQEILGKTDLNYLDVVIPAESTESGNDFNDTDVVLEQRETDPDDDDDVIITSVVEPFLDEIEFLGRKSMKIKSDESQCEYNSNSDLEISLQNIRPDVLFSFTKSKKRSLEDLVRYMSNGKAYAE